MHLIKNLINYQYYNLKNRTGPRVKDQAIIFGTKLQVSIYSKTIKKKIKSTRSWGFIRRTRGSWLDPIPLKMLYRSLVRSELDNRLLTGLNNTLKQNNILEPVQKDFYKFISCKFKTSGGLWSVCWRLKFSQSYSVVHFCSQSFRTNLMHCSTVSKRCL